MDNKLKFEKHVAKICRKVSQQTAVLKRMRNILPFEIGSKIYVYFIAPHFKYCSETWHFCKLINWKNERTCNPLCFQGQVYTLRGTSRKIGTVKFETRTN